MNTLCRLFGKSRQAWYKTTLVKESQAMKDMLVIGKVCRIRQELPRIGTVKPHLCLKEFLREHQIKMGRDQLHELLKSAGLMVPKRVRSVQTTYSRHRFRKYPNLAKNLTPDQANMLWVSDITYIQIGSHFAYLSLITDAYSKKIVGWKLCETLKTQGPLEALRMALKQLEKDQGTKLTHHSDRGFQYCSHAYVELLQKHGIQISMTQNGDPYENAIAERVNGTIKNEMLLKRGFIHIAEAHQAIASAIKAYNELRPHRSCDMLTPNQAHQQTGFLKKHWKNYYAIRNADPHYERHSHKPMPLVTPSE